MIIQRETMGWERLWGIADQELGGSKVGQCYQSRGGDSVIRKAKGKAGQDFRGDKKGTMGS